MIILYPNSMVDPMFEYDSTLENISNIHDFSKTHEWVCDPDTVSADVVPLAASNIPTSVSNERFEHA